jgi:hypothetical protein
VAAFLVSTPNRAVSSWTGYRTDKPLLWPADSPLTIYLFSGGFVSSSMLIDELLIIAK